MISAVKISLEVDKKNELILDGQSKILNWLYNKLLESAKTLRKEYIKTQKEDIARKLYTQRGLRNTIPELKQIHNFIKSVYSSPVKNAALRLSTSIQEYQKRKKDKSKKKVNWPKFRSWSKKWFSLLYDEPWKGYKLEENQLKLSLGKNENNKQIRITLLLHEKLPSWFQVDKVKELRITKKGKQFFAIFSVERDTPQIHSIVKKSKIIAIDPNHKNLGVGVSTDHISTEIQNPYFLKTLDKRIDCIKSKRDCCKRKSIHITRADGSKFWKPSRRWTFFNNKLLELYRIRQEQTKVYLYTVANQLFKEYDVVSVGDYTPQGGGFTKPMRRAMNNQSLIGRFKLTLLWVAKRSGRTFLEWEEKGTTRTCHLCQHIVKDGISPEVRKWICPHCSKLNLRDENSAKNGLQLTLEKLQMPCSGRREVFFRRAWKFNGLGISESPGAINGQVVCYAVNDQEIKTKGDTLKPLG